MSSHLHSLTNHLPDSAHDVIFASPATYCLKSCISCLLKLFPIGFNLKALPKTHHFICFLPLYL